MRQHLGKFFSDSDLSRWFDPLNMQIDEENGVLRIAFPHQYFGNWFMDTVKQDFERYMADFGENMTIAYEGGYCMCGPECAQPAPLKNGDSTTKRSLTTAQPEHQDRLLHEHFIFDNFLVNRKNNFPLAAARECVGKAENPPYTPFIIYGQSGSGKSHLLGAMANALIDNGKSLYFGGVAYVERLSSAPGHSDSVSEHSVFIDDAQRVSSCNSMQDTLAGLIDMFQASGRLLALSFDVHPAQCAGLGQKLRSRLAAGLVLEIKRPDLDIRRQYVQRKNALHSLGLSKEQILDIAHQYQDIRCIDGALARLSAYRALLSAQGPDAASPDLASILDRGGEHISLTPVSILLTVARDFSLPPEELTGKNRGKTVSLARHIAILLCRELLGLSLIQTGRIFSARDHSSVLYSIKKIKQLQASDKHMNKRVEDLRKLCVTRH